MMGRKSILSLSLLSVLALCAFAAQGASAAWETATETTAVTCVPEGGKKDFSDAHCKNGVGEGKFGHVTFATGTKTHTTVTNTQTEGEAPVNAVLTGSLFGATVTITCQKVAAGATEKNWLKNVATGDIEGESSVNFTECSVTGNGATCKVKEPVVTNTKVTGQKEPTTKNMALLFSPLVAGGAYTNIGFEGGCLVFATEVKGQARGTPNGATILFEAADEELTAFGNKATFTGSFTTTAKDPTIVGDTYKPLATTTIS
jgi:hypothetical protein